MHLVFRNQRHVLPRRWLSIGNFLCNFRGIIENVQIFAAIVISRSIHIFDIQYSDATIGRQFESITPFEMFADIKDAVERWVLWLQKQVHAGQFQFARIRVEKFR